MSYPPEEFFVIFFVFITGLVFGSFATAVSYRMPREEQFFYGRSRCPKCGHALGAIDLVPIVSWVLQGGQCRYCKTSFGISYLLIEFILATLFVIIYLKYGLTAKTVTLCALALIIVILTVIDFEHYIIPDQINISLFILGLLYRWQEGGQWYEFIIFPVAGFSIGMILRWLMFFWKKQEGLGMGDIKFFAAAALFLQPETSLTFFFLSGLIGIVIAIIWKILGKGAKFPFGPALAFSLFICVVFPELHYWWQYELREVISILVGYQA